LSQGKSAFREYSTRIRIRLYLSVSVRPGAPQREGSWFGHWKIGYYLDAVLKKRNMYIWPLFGDRRFHRRSAEITASVLDVCRCGIDDLIYTVGYVDALTGAC
jgi:hypothetical protein